MKKTAAILIAAAGLFFAAGCGKAPQAETKPAAGFEQGKLPQVKTDPVKKQAVLQAGAEKRKAADATRLVFEKLEAREAELRKGLKAGEDFKNLCQADEQWKTLTAEFKEKEAVLIAAQSNLMKKAREALSQKETK